VESTFDAFENAPKPPATYPRYRCMANVIHSNYSIYSIQIAILQPLAHPSVSARESVEYFAKAPLKVRLVIRDIGGHVSYATAVSQRLSSVSSNEHEQVSSNEVRREAAHLSISTCAKACTRTFFFSSRRSSPDFTSILTTPCVFLSQFFVRGISWESDGTLGGGVHCVQVGMDASAFEGPLL